MRPILVACIVTVLLAPAHAPAGVALETDVPDHIVHAGAVHPTNPRSSNMYEGYFPRHLSVHKGDHVRWEFPNQMDGAQAFHTVTFGDPDEITYVRADEIGGTLAFDERAFFTMGCGRAGQPVCVISTPGEFVSSGTPIQHSGGIGMIQPFDAVIDLPQGTYTYFCSLHHPSMQGTIQVVPDDMALNNRKPADFADELEVVSAKADAHFEGLGSGARHEIEDGRRVWTVEAGAHISDGVRVSTEAFLPSSISIAAGEKVRWVMGGTAHAITFPDTGQQGPPKHLTLNCEFDAPAAGAPGVPAVATVGAVGLPWCPPGGATEMTLTELAANQHRAPDDAVLSPATVHNSGIMIGGTLPERMRGRPPGTGQYFPSEFEASFPVAGTYPYRCMIHWAFMGGVITVT